MKHLLYFLKQIHSFAGKKLYVNLLAIVFMGLLEGIGILLLIPMLSVTSIVNLDTEGSPIFRIFSFLQVVSFCRHNHPACKKLNQIF